MTYCDATPLPDEPSCVAVIPVHNAERTLGQCIAALKRSPLVDQVVVVDDASTDGSARLAAESGAEVIRLDTNRGPSAARNAGLTTADASVVVLCDADVIVADGTIGEMVDDLRATAACVVTCAPTGASTGRWLDRYKASYMQTSFACLPSEIDLLHGSLCAVKTLCVAPFDESLRLGEDVELGRRMQRAGHLIQLSRRASWVHLHQYRLMSLLKNDFLVPRALAKTFVTELQHDLRQQTDWWWVKESRIGHTSGRQLVMLGSVVLGLLAPLAVTGGHVRIAMAAALTGSTVFYLAGSKFLSGFRAEFGGAGAAVAAVMLHLDHHVMLAGALYGAAEGILGAAVGLRLPDTRRAQA